MLDSCPTTAPAQRSHLPALTDMRQLTKLSPTDGMHCYSLGVLPHLPSQPIRFHSRLSQRMLPSQATPSAHSLLLTLRAGTGTATGGRSGQGPLG